MSQIGAILEHYGAQVPQRQGWAKMRCLMPGHDDRIPSATVNHTTNRFHCFACGVNEDPIGLIRLLDGVGYADAKRRAAEIAGESDSYLSGTGFRSEWLPERSGNRFGRGREVAAWRGLFA